MSFSLEKPLPMGAILRLGVPRTRYHQGAIKAVAFSPDAKKVASGGYDKTVIIWDTQTGEELYRSPEQVGSICALAFAPDGKMLAFVSAKKVHFLDLTGEARPRSFSIAQDDPYSLSYSPDGAYLAVGGYYRPIQIYSVQKGTVQKEIQANGRRVLFSSKGDLAIEYGMPEIYPGVLQHRKVPTPIRCEASSYPLTFAFSPKGDALWTVEKNGEILHFEAATGRRLSSHNKLALARSSWGALSFDGKLLAYANEKWLEVIELSSGESVPRLQYAPKVETPALAQDPYRSSTPAVVESKQPLLSPKAQFAVRPDGETLAISTKEGVFFYEAHTGKQLGQLLGATGEGVLAFSPDGALLAFGQRGIGLFETKTGTRVGWLASDSVQGMAFSSDSSLLVAWTKRAGSESPFGEGCGRVEIFSVPERRSLAAFAHDSFEVTERVAAGTDAEATWTREPLVRSAAFSKEGKLATCGGDNTKLWERRGEEWAQIRVLDVAALMVGFLPDGGLLTVDPLSIKLWSSSLSLVSSSKLSASLAALSKDGQRVAVFSNEAIRVLEVGRFVQSAEYRGHKGEVHSLSFSSDGGLLASASEEGSVLVWSVGLGVG